MNIVILKGNLTRSPEMKIKGDLKICNFGLAVSEKYRDKENEELKEKTCFIEVSAFGGRAETITKHIKKGDPVLIEGKLNFEQWESDGEKRQRLSVILENFEFLNRRESSE